jgi:hypothetical protein
MPLGEDEEQIRGSGEGIEAKMAAKDVRRHHFITYGAENEHEESFLDFRHQQCCSYQRVIANK